jgi:hypothetical protein
MDWKDLRPEDLPWGARLIYAAMMAPIELVFRILARHWYEKDAFGRAA